MRVLLSFSTRIGTTGIGTTAWYQATSMAAHGADVTVACGSVERPLLGCRVAIESMRLGRQRLPYRVVGFNRATHIHDLRVARLIASHAGDFDVVHAWPGGAEHTLRAARAARIPAFLERPNAHTRVAFETVAAECARLGIAVSPGSPHAFDSARLAREEREFASADALLCPSDFVAATHAAQGERPERLLRHRYGYDPARFAPPTQPRSPGAPVTVTFLGRIEPRKGAHLALNAWARAGAGQRARLRLVGALEPGYERVIADLAAQPGVEVRSHDDDPSVALQESDALILPSLEEGSALVTYEARGAGAALLVSDRSGAYATHDHDALIHPAGDVDVLAGHLRAFCADRGLRDRLRNNALAGRRELTWEAAGRVLLDAYRDGTDRLRRTAQPPSAQA